MIHKSPTVSIVVCTKNRCGHLVDAIRSLTALDCNESYSYEIVIVDNGSTDDTVATVESLQAESSHTTIRRVFEPAEGVASARNCGIKESTGDWIAFFDDDQVAEPQWLNELLGIAISKNALCAGGQVTLSVPDHARRNLGPLCRDLLSETVGEAEPRPYDRRFKPGAGNLLIHRSVFDKVGVFDADLKERGEDTVLFLRMLERGISAWFNPQAIVHHKIPAERMSDEAFLRMSRIQARQMPRFEKHHWGPLFPMAWAARIAQLILVKTPQLLLAQCSGDVDRSLEAKCQFEMTRLRIWHGRRLLLTRGRNRLALPQPR